MNVRFRQLVVFALVFVSIPATVMASGQAAAEVEEAEPVTITFWGHNFAPVVKMYEGIIEKFQEEYPHITVEYHQKAGAQYAELFLQAFAANSSPDAFRVGDWIIAEFIRDGAIAPLDLSAFSASSAAEVEDRFMPGTLEPFVRGGDLYAIPESINTLRLYVNMGHMREAGYSNVPSDSAGWVEAKKKMTVVEGDRWTRSGFEWKYNHELWDLIQFTGVLRSFGTRIYGSDGKLALDKAKTTAALKYYYDSIHTHKFANPDFATSAGGNFPDGFFSTAIAGAYWVPTVERKGIVTDWTSATWITGSQPSSMRWSWCLGVSSQSEQKSAASTLVAFMTDPDVQTIREEAGNSTGLKGWESLESIQKNPKIRPWYEAMATATYVDSLADYAKATIALSTVLQEIAFAGLEPEAAYDKLYGQLSAIE